MKFCSICGSPLNLLNRPWTLDCGGDCRACMAEAGDPDCQITSVRKVTNATKALVVARSDAAFDGRNYDTLGRADRIRYEQRALAGIAALEAAFGGQP